MKKFISVILFTVLMASLCTGCGKDDEKMSAPQGSTDSSVLSAEENEPQSAGEDASKEPVDPIDMNYDDEENAEGPGGEKKSGVVTEDSDYGYSLTYDASKYEYKRVEGCDDYALKKYEADRPTVYVSISLIEKEYVSQVEASLFSGSTKNTAIGKDRVSAKYSETTDVWDEGKILCGAYLCPLSNGNVLLIETQSYTIGENASYAQDIQNMLNSIVLK